MISHRHIACLALTVFCGQAALARSSVEVLAVLDHGQAEAALKAAGLPSVPTPFAPANGRGQTSHGAAALEEADLRLALMQLALQAGTNDQLALLRAQADKDAPKALVMRGGTATLAELGELARALGTDGLTRTGDVWTLKLPLVIWQDAALQLAPGESLLIERAAGAFVLGFGELSVTEARISGSDTANLSSPEFRPFVLVAGAGSLDLDHAELSGLGFSDGNFGGLAVAGSGLFKPEFGPRIVASTFEDVALVALDGSADVRIEGSTFAGSSLMLTGVTDTEISRNQFTDAAGTAALMLDEASQDVTLSGNFISGAQGMGLLIDGLSRRIRLTGNVVDESGGVGINIRHSACLIASGNLVARSTSSGMRLTATGAAWLSDNALIANRSAGIDLVGQSGSAPVVLVSNWFSANTVGLKGGEIGSVFLSDNDLSGQLPRQFGGAFAPHLPGYLAVAEGAIRPGDYVISDLRAGPLSARAEPLRSVRADSPWPADCQQE